LKRNIVVLQEGLDVSAPNNRLEGEADSEHFASTYCIDVEGEEDEDGGRGGGRGAACLDGLVDAGVLCLRDEPHAMRRACPGACCSCGLSSCMHCWLAQRHPEPVVVAGRYVYGCVDVVVVCVDGVAAVAWALCATRCLLTLPCYRVSPPVTIQTRLQVPGATSLFPW
jgi:hypothetical protein